MSYLYLKHFIWMNPVCKHKENLLFVVQLYNTDVFD